MDRNQARPQGIEPCQSDLESNSPALEHWDVWYNAYMRNQPLWFLLLYIPSDKEPKLLNCRMRMQLLWWSVRERLTEGTGEIVFAKE